MIQTRQSNIAGSLAAGALLAVLSCLQPAGAQAPPPDEKADPVLHVCADPFGMPQSNDRGEGYENKIAEALAKDLGKKVEYTFFPQRMGFVRMTLRARDETTLKFKCDLIMGVPTGYDLTATTKPYMRSTYALVFSQKHPEFKSFETPDDLLALPQDKLQKMRIGIFGHSPAADWLLAANLIEHAEMYSPQSGDPKETANTIVARDLSSGKIDAAVVWGPIAGQLVRDHSDWTSIPFKTDAKFRFDYEMAMGLRQGEKEWKDTLDQWIGSHHEQINQILTGYQVPLLELSPPKPGA
jgi:quinoprotein dehydrogenase-associated probable ABC transporter substrate-binding protein